MNWIANEFQKERQKKKTSLIGSKEMSDQMNALVISPATNYGLRNPIWFFQTSFERFLCRWMIRSHLRSGWHIWNVGRGIVSISLIVCRCIVARMRLPHSLLVSFLVWYLGCLSIFVFFLFPPRWLFLSGSLSASVFLSLKAWLFSCSVMLVVVLFDSWCQPVDVHFLPQTRNAAQSWWVLIPRNSKSTR